VEQSPVYEVRCERCQTSFAPETRRCIHCGGPLGRGRVFAALTPGAEGRGMEEDGAELASRGRSLVWVMTALAVMAASLVRTCVER
jgi:hypothetical protein